MSLRVFFIGKKSRLIEPFLGGPPFLAAVLKSSTWIPYPSVLAHGTRFFVRHTSNFEFRLRSGRLQAIGCTRWLLVGCFTTKVSTCTRRSTLHSLWECRLLLCCCIAQLLSWLVICVSRVTCDFVSRLGGWDTKKHFQRTAD